MSRIFIDTNVAVYAFANHPFSDKAEAILVDAPFLSVQVLNEFTSVSRRKFNYDWVQVEAAINKLLGACGGLSPVTLDTHETARRLAERYRLHIYDANIAAAALDCGCDILLSEDMHDGLVIDDRLTIRNPFAGN